MEYNTGISFAQGTFHDCDACDNKLWDYGCFKVAYCAGDVGRLAWGSSMESLKDQWYIVAAAEARNNSLSWPFLL